VAFAAKGQLDDAKKEQASLETALAAIPADAPYDFDTVHQYLDVEKHLVAGEIMVREDGQMEAGLAELQKGVDAQDALHYSEPPDWLIPARHSLGAGLLLAKKYPEAEAVYRDDLARNPENGWSLYGLAKALRLEGKTKEAAAVDRRFKKAWSAADVTIESSCLCLPGKA
jgi:tetratricopeptide (TPR) repeat protein